MYNKTRTLEVFRYDLESTKRRTSEQLETTDKKRPRDMLVVDNCPICGVERTIKLKQSRKNKPCSKCFHNTPEMKAVKIAQKGKHLTEEHKQHLKENHWSTKGYESAFKGKHHTDKAKAILSKNAVDQFNNMSDDDFELHRVKSSLQKGRTLETFNGFTTPENTRIRQSPEGKAWTYDVLAKSNFTCVRCQTRGGSLCSHHLNGFNAYPEQRLDPDNGTCLCDKCHDEFHEIYGKGDNTKEQFDEWLQKVQSI